MRTGVGALLTVLVLGTTCWRNADAEELKPVLLPVQEDSSIASLSEELNRAFTLQGMPVQRSSLKLEDLMLAVGCKTINISCLQNIGQSVKASGLIIPRARRVKEGVELSLRWFEVKSGGDLGEFMRLLPSDHVLREQILNDAVREMLGSKAAPSTREQNGGLSISSSVPYVEILLDGQARGTVPVEFRNLRVGTYQIVGRRDGYLTWQGKAVVKPDQMTHVEVDMAPSPQAPGQTSYFDSVRPTTWAVGGAGLLCLAVGSAFAAHMKAQQDHLDSAKGITLDEILQMRDFQETGERDALAANILFGIGGAALVGAAVLSYFDYRRTRSEGAAEPAARLNVGPGSVSVHLGF